VFEVKRRGQHGGRPGFNGEVGLSHLPCHRRKREIFPTSRGEISAGHRAHARSAVANRAHTQSGFLVESGDARRTRVITESRGRPKSR